MNDVSVPASLDLLDVAGNGMDCERFLWIRGLSDRELPPKARIDVIDDVQRFPGELLHVASSDGRMAATLATIRDDAGAGSCYLTVFCQEDPGEPSLGALVELASDRARAAGVADVRCGEAMDRPHMPPLVERHGFVEHERWRRFHVDVAETGDAPELPSDVRVSTLADRRDLAEDAFRVYRDGVVDTAGDFPRVDESLESWLRDIDGSPVLGRDFVLVLHDASDRVLALVELERLAARSDRAWVEFLAVDRDHRGRGHAAQAKQHAVAHAARLGLRRLQTMNHADNVAICRLNERLGWVEDPVRVALRRPVG